jgi:anti-sigma regulatory factor (Ser/Thr protein kinase)
MTARSSQLAGLAAPVGASWLWLRPAAEMAALLTARWSAEPGSGLEPAPVPARTVGQRADWAVGRAGWAAGPLVATRTPAPVASSVASARAFTLRTLRRWGAADCAEDVSMIVSELLTNAVRHAVPEVPRAISPIRIGLLHPGPCVLCAVADPSDRLPVLREADGQAESGRGLHVVESLSASWGYCPVRDAHGKVVWATVPTTATGRLLAGMPA